MKLVLIFILLFILSFSSFAKQRQNRICPSGSTLVHFDPDDRGCFHPPICVNQNDCPQFVSPAPNFCSDGTIVKIGVDSRGCQRPPVCVHSNDCPQWTSPGPDFCPNGRVVHRGRDEKGCFKTPVCVRDNDCPSYEHQAQ